MKYNTFIVDAYNLFYRANYVTDETIVKYQDEKFHTEGIIGFISLMEGYIKKYGTDDVKIYWLFDNAKTSIKKYRKALSEDYKKTRVPQPEWFYKQLDMLELILKSYRNDSYLFRVQGLEADDYISAIISSYISSEDNVLLISEDMDWFRGLSENIHQYTKGKIYTKKDFFEEYGFEATYSNICFYKTFYGDKSDCIKPSLMELPKKFFVDIISKYDTIYKFINGAYNNCLPYLDLGWIARIKKEESFLLLNWNLVTSADISLNELNSFCVKCKFQENKLSIIYEALNLVHKIKDTRMKYKEDKNDVLDDLLEGVYLNRKKI